jgi:hypothetical protein
MEEQYDERLKQEVVSFKGYVTLKAKYTVNKHVSLPSPNDERNL